MLKISITFAPVFLRLFGLFGVVGGVWLLLQLGQPIEPQFRPEVVRGSLFLLSVFSVLLSLLAAAINFLQNLEPQEENSPFLNYPLAIICTFLALLGLAGFAVTGFRIARSLFTHMRGWWVDRRAQRLNRRYDPDADVQSVLWYVDGFRVMRKIFAEALQDYILRAIALLALFIIGLAFSISQLLLLLVIPFIVLSLVQRGVVGAVCILFIFVYFIGMFLIGGLSRNDLWSGYWTARFLTQIDSEQMMMIYRFALVMIIIAAAVTMTAVIWVPVGGLAFGALLYLFVEKWPCLPMMRACSFDPASKWGYPAIGLLLFAGLFAQQILTRRRQVGG